MNYRNQALALLLCVGPSIALAAPPPQVFATVTFAEPGGNAVGQTLVVTTIPGFLSVGHQNGYPAILCTPSSRTLKAVTLFSGYIVTYALAGDDVELTVKKYSVSVPPDTAYNTAETCKSVLPQQHTLVDKTLRLPIGVSNQTIKLPDGSVMRYSVSGAAS